MQTLKSFLVKEIIFTVSLVIIAYILFSTILKSNYYPVFWAILALISILTALLHYSILKVSDKDIAKFSPRFLMATGIKMMVYLVFITAYVFLNHEKATFFLISFFALYIFYTVFEIIIVLKYLKKK